jgi:putative transcriptional regulator
MYRYRECGLDDVTLVNGYKRVKTPYGEGVSIVDIDGLHTAIADVLTKKPGPLTAQEFRFLRKHLKLSQDALANLIGADVQALARWEKSKSAIPGPSDRLLRALCEQHAKGDADIREIVERLRDADERDLHEIRLKRGPRSWKAAA